MPLEWPLILVANLFGGEEAVAGRVDLRPGGFEDKQVAERAAGVA